MVRIWRKLLVATVSTVVTTAAVLWGLESWYAAKRPDPAVTMRRNTDTKWASLVHRRSAVDGLIYELNPGFDGRFIGTRVRINEHGLRGEAVELAKPKGVRRIAVLGDSTTFGYGVEDWQTYAHFLEEHLAAGDPAHEYEVLNFGTSGYNTLDEAVVLRTKALRFDPDLIVLGYNLNDADAEYQQPLHRTFADLPWWQDTHLYQHRARQARSRRIAAAGGPLRYMYDRDGRNWAVVTEGLEQIAATLDDAGLQLVIAIFPGTQRVSELPFGWVREQVAEEAARHGFAVVDLAPPLAAAEEAGATVMLEHIHPTPRGHRIVARAIADHVLERLSLYF